MLSTIFAGFWIIRYLGPAGFGDLCIVRAVQIMLDVIADMGLTQLLPIRLSNKDESSAEVLATAFALRSITGVVAAILSIPVLVLIQGYGSEEAGLLLVAALFLLVSPSKIAEQWFIARGKARIVVISRVISLLMKSAFQVGAILLGFHVLALLAIDVIAMLVFGTLLNVMLWTKHRPEGVFRTRWSTVGSFTRASLPIWLAAVATILSVRVDQTMLGVIADDTAAGLYSAAARLSEFWFFAPVAIISNTVPILTRRFEAQGEGYQRNILQVSSALTCFSIVVALLTTAFAEPLVTMLFTAEYSDSAGVLTLHVWSLPFFALGYLSHNLRIIQGQQSSLLVRCAVGAGANILLNLLLIPVCGIYGAATATLISYFIGGVGWDLMIDRSHNLGRLQAKSFLPGNWYGSARMVFLRTRLSGAR